MKKLLLLTVLSFLACTTENHNSVQIDLPESVFSYSREIEKGNLFFIEFESVRSARFKQILEREYLVKYEYMPKMSEENINLKRQMDSTLFRKFGMSFLIDVQNKADSLDSIYPNYLTRNGAFNYLKNKPVLVNPNVPIFSFTTLDTLGVKDKKIVIDYVVDEKGQISKANVIIHYSPLLDSIAKCKLLESEWIPGYIELIENNKKIKKVVPYRSQITFKSRKTLRIDNILYNHR
jgi:hypothetical protein